MAEDIDSCSRDAPGPRRPAQGALPTLSAAIAPDVAGGDYYRPHGIEETRAYAVRVGTSEAAKKAEDAARLWKVGEELTGVRYASMHARATSS